MPKILALDALENEKAGRKPGLFCSRLSITPRNYFRLTRPWLEPQIRSHAYPHAFVGRELPPIMCRV
jgi:hypothetical protein